METQEGPQTTPGSGCSVEAQSDYPQFYGISKPGGAYGDSRLCVLHS
jgi:hypothetical protein